MSNIRSALNKIREERSEAPESPEVAAVVNSATTKAASPLVADKNGPVVRVDLAELCDAGLHPPIDHQRKIADQFRLIKRPLIDNASGKGAHASDIMNLIMITSPLPGDGKTFSCLNLALSMAAEKDRSILLVDADVAKPHISQVFGLQQKPGLIDLLLRPETDIRDAIIPTSLENLWILPSGREDEHATELLASDRMASLVQALSGADSDWIVVFDSPPLLLTSEARVLAKSMGQIVLVVSAGRTSHDAVVDAASSLDTTKPVSVIFNRDSGQSGLEYHGYGARRYGSVVDGGVRR